MQLEDDASRNPEIDSFQYIYMILESLNKLGRLDVAVTRLEQRLPIELFNIVGKTNQEVDQRHPGNFGDNPETRKDMQDLDYDGDSSRSHVLRELLFTLYSKFTAIAEGHRAVHDIVAGIVAREGLRHPEPLVGGFKEMWKLYQSEVSYSYTALRISTKVNRYDHSCMTIYPPMAILPIGQPVTPP
jgi:exocyst complex component 4